MSQDALNEKLLSVWVALSVVLRNDRFMQHLTFNEAYICALLRKQRETQPAQPYLAMRDLSKKSRMLKSQVNKIVTDMERKGLVLRHRSEQDRRVVYVEATEKGRRIHSEEHERILHIVDGIIADVGEADVQETVALLEKVICAVDRYIERGE